MNKTDREKFIARALKTDYGREEFRRSIIRGLKNRSTEGSKEGLLARCLLDCKTFGEIPEEWETNPHKWSFQSQLNIIGS
jgi:hypothetical protein